MRINLFLGIVLLGCVFLLAVPPASPFKAVVATVSLWLGAFNISFVSEEEE